MFACAGTITFERELSAMTAKEVASALSVLTSDGLECCKEWADNYFVEAFIADYFTASPDDEVFKVSSVNYLTGTFQSNSTVSKC